MILTMSDIANANTLKKYSLNELVLIASRIEDAYLKNYFIHIVALMFGKDADEIAYDVNFEKAKAEDGELI